MATKKVTLNTWSKNNVTVTAIQGEIDSRFLEIALVDNYAPINLTSKSIQIYLTKPDGNIVYNDVEIIDPLKGKIFVALTSEISAVCGIIQNCEIRVTDIYGSTLKFNGLNIVVYQGMSDSHIESSSEFTALHQAMSDVTKMNYHVESNQNPHKVTPNQIGALSNSQRGTANGVAALNSNAKLTSSQLETASDSDKIKLINLSEEVQAAMAGTAPVISSVVDNSLTTSKYANNSITTAKIASGTSVDKWKNWLHYDGFSDLNLTYSTCTIGDICTAMSTKSKLTHSLSNISATYPCLEVPNSRGMINIYKANDWSCYLEFLADGIISDPVYMPKKWYGSWRADRSLTFSGWTLVFNQNELIPLNSINIGELEDNLFNPQNCTDGGYYNETTFAWVPSSTISTTDFINASPGEKLALYTNVNSPNHVVAFKNSNGEIFYAQKRLPDIDKFLRFTVPNGAVSFACAFITEQKNNIKIGHESIYNGTLSGYIKDVSNTYFSSKKINFLGDSITYGYTPGSGVKMSRPYPTVVKELLNLNTSRNYGIDGSSIAVGGDSPMVSRYSNMDNDADIICVFGGTNDWGKIEDSKKRPLGTISSTDNTTVYGALNELCNGLITKYPKATIFLITPLHRTNESTSNTHGYILKDVATAIIDVGKKFGIPVLDLFSNGNFYPINSAQNSNCSGDGLHPNQWFHENVLARKITSFLKSII